MPSPDRVAIAHERIAARAHRIRLIRRRVVAGTLAAFVLAWGVIAFDGAMGEPNSNATAQVSSSSTATATSSSRDDSTWSGDSTSSSDTATSSSPGDSAATMTTTQS